MKAHDIIIKPVITEKASAGINDKRYVFKVDVRADKTAVKNAVEEAFDVQVEKVNIVNVSGKYKRQGKSEGYTSKYKKAYVQLKEKSKAIPFFESLS